MENYDFYSYYELSKEPIYGKNVVTTMTSKTVTINIDGKTYTGKLTEK